MRGIVFVAGCHRSGTSWLARALSLCGADLGIRADWQAEDNPKGFWEDRLLLDLDERMLQAGATTWYEPQVVDMDLPLETRGLLLSDRDPGQVAVFKDPRVCWTWPTWRKVFPEAVLLASLRHPGATVASLTARGGVESQIALDLWYSAYRLLEAFGARFVGFPGQEGLEEAIESVGLGPVLGQLAGWYDQAAVHQMDQPVPEKYQELYDRLMAGIGEEVAVG